MKCNYDLNSIGRRIAEQRRKNNLTQAELAKKIAVSREMINYWEKGNRDIKTASVVLLAEALNTTCDYLLHGVDLQNADITKETGLSNEAINNLRKIAKFSTKSNPLFSSLDAFLTSKDLDSFLMHFYLYQTCTLALNTAIFEFREASQKHKDVDYKSIIADARSIDDEDDDLFCEADHVTGAYEGLDFNIYKMQNDIKDIAERYTKNILAEYQND